MAQSHYVAENWLTKNQREMITCPYQPGQLKISKNACLKRHRVAQKDPGNFIREDFFNYTLKKGLSLCRDCQIGRSLAFSRPLA